MKKFLTLLILPLMFVSFFPVSASAETNAGIKPSSFFYFFDTTFEKVGLFFIFDSEKKARKALEYADERLAEAEESANDNKPKAVEKAMEGYKKEISFATEKSKELKDEKKTEELLNTVSESTARHQEILAEVLDKVSNEAKEAILKAIEVSKKGQEEALREIATLREEVTELKDEIQELKEELENKTEKTQVDESDKKIEQLKKEIEELRQEVKQPKTEDKKEVSRVKKDEPKTVLLPNGAIVQMNGDGDIIKTIKEAPIKNSEVIQQKQSIQTTPAQSNLPSRQAMEITLTKMLRQQCYDTYSTRARIQTNIDKISSNQVLKVRERQELLAEQEKEIADIRNATDSYSVRRRAAGNEEDYINFKRGLHQQRLDSFDATWDMLHSVIGSTNLSQSREEMCNF